MILSDKFKQALEQAYVCAWCGTKCRGLVALVAHNKQVTLIVPICPMCFAILHGHADGPMPLLNN